MEETVKTGAILDRISILKDGTLKLTFETQEITPALGAELFARVNKFVWLILAGEATPEIEIPDEPPPEFKADKHPSQRLRSVLYVWWSKQQPKENFETFYRAKVESMIDWIKGKIQDIEIMEGGDAPHGP